MRNKYKIEETNDNPKQIVISRPGKKVKFTLEDVEMHVIQLEKLKKECEATIEHGKAKMKNIEEHHPIVFQLTEREAFTVYLYQQAKEMIKPFEEKLEEVDTQLKEYEEDVAEIKEQLPELNV